MPHFTFGNREVLKNTTVFKQPCKNEVLSQEQIKIITDNVIQNVTSTAKDNPQCIFYYFLPPYSAAWWGKIYESGNLERQLQIEKLAIELILECKNIKLYSFDTEFNIITNLNNYRDETHYGEWINSLILEYMAQERGLLTKDNYLSYLDQEREFYSTFDYNSLFYQEDEEDPPCDLQ